MRPRVKGDRVPRWLRSINGDYATAINGDYATAFFATLSREIHIAAK